MDIVINADAVESRHKNSTALITQGNYYHNILARLGYPVDAPPVGDLLRQYHKLEGSWLVASPIHWQATHNDAMITACANTLNLSEDVSRKLFDELSNFLKNDPIKLHYHDAHTWLIRLYRNSRGFTYNPGPRPSLHRTCRLGLGPTIEHTTAIPVEPLIQATQGPQINAKPVSLLINQPIMESLNNLDSTLFWQKFLTENQMFFSQHFANLSQVNGLWVWGAGQLRAPCNHPIITTDARTHDLAMLLSTRVSNYSKYKKNALLLLSDANTDMLSCVETNKARWYWNNLAYTNSVQRSWFGWRKV